MHLTPDYSIPIGPVIFTPNDFTYNLSIISDTSITDSNMYIFFEGNYYETDTDYIELSEHLTFELSGLSDINNIRYMTFIFINYNYAPLEVSSQLYFFDNSSVLLDSLFEDGPITYPPPDLDANGNGNVLNEHISIHSVTFDTTDIRAILNTVDLEILVVAKLIPNDSNIVVFDTSNYLKINTALRFGINAD